MTGGHFITGIIMETKLRKRCISLFVENEVGVLAYISGLFSGKSYNLDSLTVGTTIDPSVSRMTITLTSDDRTFEQIKKQLNRSVPVIRVVDLTGADIFMKELMYAKVTECEDADLKKIARLGRAHGASVVDCVADAILLECVGTERENDVLLDKLKKSFPDRVEIVRGGNVAIESLPVK